jgi:transposase InsO family protein
MAGSSGCSTSWMTSTAKVWASRSTFRCRRSGSSAALPRSSNGAESRAVIRVDNGPDYISGKLLEWAETRGISIRHIQPGKPRPNAYIERYNRAVRQEWLDQHIFDPIEEAQDFATQWLWSYNNDRPNMGIGGMTPAQMLNAAA